MHIARVLDRWIKAEAKKRATLFDLLAKAMTAFNESQKPDGSVTEVRLHAEKEINGHAKLLAIFCNENQTPCQLAVNFSVDMVVGKSLSLSLREPVRYQLRASFKDGTFVPMANERDGDKVEITNEFEEMATRVLLEEMNRQGIVRVPDSVLNGKSDR